MSVEDSDSRRFELNILLSFPQADLGPTSAQEYFFSFFFQVLKLLCEDLCSKRVVQNLMASIFEILTFFGNIAFP